MYTKVECICLTCDNCGETFESSNGFSIFSYEEQAHEYADIQGWYMYSEDFKHYCGKCHHVDDEDNLVITR